MKKQINKEFYLAIISGYYSLSTKYLIIAMTALTIGFGLTAFHGDFLFLLIGLLVFVVCAVMGARMDNEASKLIKGLIGR